jgi:alkylation response protein AidB-like acyl-CoA dehydrogenase
MPTCANLPQDRVSGEQERQLLADSAKSFAARELDRKRLRALRDRGRDFDPLLWRKMADLGWLGLLLPERTGGFGLGLAEAAVIAEELGGALAPVPFVASGVFAGRLLSLSTNEALKEVLLPKIGQGLLAPAVAWEEGALGLDAAMVRTKAETRPGEIRITGAKDFIRPAQDVDGFIVSATDDDGLSLYWIEASNPGLELRVRLLADGSHCGRLRLDKAKVDRGHVLASGIRAEDLLRQAFDESLILASAELLGVMKAAFAVTVEYLKTRVQFDRPIGSFQALQHRMVDLFIQKELAQAAIGEALAAHANGVKGRGLSALASRTKARASSAALMITREAIQMHGAIGFTDEHDIGLYLKRALVLSAWLGNAAQHRRRYGALSTSNMPAGSPPFKFTDPTDAAERP